MIAGVVTIEWCFHYTTRRLAMRETDAADETDNHFGS